MGITSTGSSLGDSTDGYVTPNPEVYNAVADPVDHEADTSTLSPKEAPRHDKYAAENEGPGAERVVPYTPTGGNPSYPQDQAEGFETAEPEAEVADAPEAQAEAAPEAEAEPEEGVLNPAGIPAPPETEG